MRPTTIFVRIETKLGLSGMDEALYSAPWGHGVCGIKCPIIP